MNKRYLLVVLALIAGLNLTACGEEKETELTSSVAKADEVKAVEETKVVERKSDVGETKVEEKKTESDVAKTDEDEPDCE